MEGSNINPPAGGQVPRKIQNSNLPAGRFISRQGGRHPPENIQKPNSKHQKITNTQLLITKKLFVIINGHKDEKCGLESQYCGLPTQASGDEETHNVVKDHIQLEAVGQLGLCLPYPPAGGQ